MTNGGLAQLGEHLPYKQGVGGSIPSSSTTFNHSIVAGWSNEHSLFERAASSPDAPHFLESAGRGRGDDHTKQKLSALSK